MPAYEKRRYKVVDGRLQKKWDGDEDGWFLSKEAAWAAFEGIDAKPKVEAAPIGDVVVIPNKPKRKRKVVAK